MPDLPTRAELFEIGAAEVLTRAAARPLGERISEEAVFTEGSDINVLVNTGAALAEEVMRQLGLRIEVLFLDGATGADLDRLVADRFSPSIVRKAATPALVTLSLSRGSGSLPAVTIAIGTRFRSSTGIEYTTLAVASFAAAFAGTVTVPAQCVTAGTSGNAAAGTITAPSEPLSDPAIVVTNPEPAAGGDDSESDASLRERARAFFRTARRGTLSAIEFGALSVAGVRSASAIEELDSGGNPTGRVALFIADALGQANSALVAAVRSALVEYRAAGIIVDVSAAVPNYVPIEYLLRFAAGVDTTAAADTVRFATVAAVNALAPGETLPVSLLFSVARSVAGVIVLDDAVVEPVGDLVPATGQVIRTRADLVSFV